MKRPLVILESHPVQYHAPVYRATASLGVPVVAVYASDFSVGGYKDREFGTEFSWDTDLLGGYDSRFLGRVSHGGATSADLCTPVGIEGQLKNLNPAAVLVSGYASPFDRGAISAAFGTGSPVLLRAETTDHARKRSLLKRLLRDWKLKSLYRRLSKLFYIGENSLAHYRRLGVPDSKLIASKYCVDTGPFRCSEADRTTERERVRIDLKIGPEQIVLLFSGKIVERKGVDLLVPAVKALPEELAKRSVLVFLGDGELRERIGSEARIAGIETRFLGFQNQTKLSPFYHAADALVLPSRTGETWGLVVNEALHHGLPVVASNAVGCVPDLVAPGETGEVFGSDEVVELTAALTRAIPCLGRLESREACRDRVSKYSVATAAAGIAEAYRAVTS